MRRGVLSEQRAAFVQDFLRPIVLHREQDADGRASLGADECLALNRPTP